MVQNKFKSEFLKKHIIENSGIGDEYLNVHITAYLSQNNVPALIQGISIALKNNGYDAEAELMNNLTKGI